MAPVVVRPGRPDGGPLDVAGVGRIDHQVVAQQHPAPRGPLLEPDVSEPGPAGREHRPDHGQHAPARVREQIQLALLGGRKRAGRFGHDQHAAAGAARVGDAVQRLHVVPVAAQRLGERRVAAVGGRLEVRLAVPLAEANGGRMIVGDGQDGRHERRLAAPAAQRRARLTVGADLGLDQVGLGDDLGAAARREHDRPLPQIEGVDAVLLGRRLGALGRAVGIDHLRRKPAARLTDAALGQLAHEAGDRARPLGVPLRVREDRRLHGARQLAQNGDGLVRQRVELGARPVAAREVTPGDHVHHDGDEHRQRRRHARRRPPRHRRLLGRRPAQRRDPPVAAASASTVTLSSRTIGRESTMPWPKSSIVRNRL